MSDRKIRQPKAGNPKPAATRLKELSTEVRAKVLEILKGYPYQEAESSVGNLVGFVCSTDVLCRFRKWQEAQQLMECGQDRLQHMAEFLKIHVPGLKGDRLRELGMLFYSFKAMAEDDPKSFLRFSEMAIRSERQICRAWKMQLEDKKFAAREQTKLQVAVDYLAERCKGNPVALEHYMKMRGALGQGDSNADPSSPCFDATRCGTRNEEKAPENIEQPTTNIEQPISDGDGEKVPSTKTHPSPPTTAGYDATRSPEKADPPSSDYGATSPPLLHNGTTRPGAWDAELAGETPALPGEQPIPMDRSHCHDEASVLKREPRQEAMTADFLRQRALFNCGIRNAECGIEGSSKFQAPSSREQPTSNGRDE